MLIPFSSIVSQVPKKITGILHVGAHMCEEKQDYNKCGISDTRIHWVEGNPNIVADVKSKYPDVNIYEGCIDVCDGVNKTFYITNNGQSSSLLQFGSHRVHHPWVSVTHEINVNTTRLDTLIQQHSIDMSGVNFVNLDIQGVELNALKSMETYLSTVDYVYTEVNTEYVYKDCCLIQEIDEYLKQYGFIRSATKIYKQYGWGDALYVKCD